MLEVYEGLTKNSLKKLNLNELNGSNECVT